jgi:ATP-binding cassette subfamily B protein
LRPYWRQALLIVFSQAPATAFITLQPLLLRSLLDDAIVPGNASLAAGLIAAMVGLLLLHGLGDLANHYLVARVVASVMSDLRLRMFTHLQRLSVSFYARSRSGDLLARFTTDLEGIERALAEDVPQAIYCVLTVAVGAGLLFTIEWRLAAVVFAAIVLPPAMPLLPRGSLRRRPRPVTRGSTRRDARWPGSTRTSRPSSWCARSASRTGCARVSRTSSRTWLRPPAGPDCSTASWPRPSP